MPKKNLTKKSKSKPKPIKKRGGARSGAQGGDDTTIVVTSFTTRWTWEHTLKIFLATVIICIIVVMVYAPRPSIKAMSVRASTLGAKNAVLTQISSIKPSCNVTQKNKDGVDNDMHAYDADINQIVLASVEDLEDQESVVIVGDYELLYGVPHTAGMEDIVDLPVDRTIPAYVSWCHTNGYCISIGDATVEIKEANDVTEKCGLTCAM